MESEADILNKIEAKARKGQATGRELRVLSEAYIAYGVPMPEDIAEGLKWNT